MLLSILLVGWVAPNVKTTFTPYVETPVIGNHSRIHPLAAVIGSVTIGQRVFVAPAASVRGDEGQHIYIGNESNVQDGVVVHGLETFEGDHELPENEVDVNGKKYSVYIGDRVSLAHQSQVHGPAKIGDDTFIGMQALISPDGGGRPRGCGARSQIDWREGAQGRYVPALSLITKQVQADSLPVIKADYAYRHLNENVIRVNIQLAEATQPQTVRNY